MSAQAPPRDDDALLLEAALSGDRRAFGELTVRHQARSLALATRLLGSRDEAHDAVQEAALRAYQALGSFVPGRPFYPWFYRILRNGCIQRLRSRKVRRSISLHLGAPEDDGLFDWPDARTLRPEDLLARSEVGEHIAAALVRLPPADAEILILKHFDGLSYKEIAEALSIPVGTVMSRLHTARRRLRNQVPELATTP